MKSKNLLTIIMLVIFFTSCKKDVEFTSKPDDFQASRRPAIPAYVFDWEQTTYMPTDGSSNIPMPWNSGSNSIDPSIISDFKKTDGWVLLWNTFSPSVNPTTIQSPLFFSLYNRYRGLLRLYVWQKPIATASNYVTHSLAQKIGSGSLLSLLNYSAQDLVDLENPIANFSAIHVQPITSNQGSWYVFQYEIAYDPELANTSFPNYYLEFNAAYTSVSSIQLEGDANSLVNGTIGAQPAPSIGGFFNNLLTNAVGTFLGSFPYIQANSNQNNSNYVAPLNNALGGVVRGYFNGILGGLSGSYGQAVSLTIATNLEINGNLVSGGGMNNFQLVIPGQVNVETADGNTPHYKELIGLFNLGSKPTVYINRNSQFYSEEDPWSGSICETYTNDDRIYLLPNSINPIFNPAVVNGTPEGVQIQDIKYEVLGLGTSGGCLDYQSLEFIEPDRIVLLNFLNPSISVPGLNSYIYQTSCNYGENCPKIPSEYVIRVSFDVQPNSGAPKSKIIKTFKANVVIN